MKIRFWGALGKLGKGTRLPKIKWSMIRWSSARIIQECQHDLVLEVSSFDTVGMSAAFCGK